MLNVVEKELVITNETGGEWKMENGKLKMEN
jgi:hypothetical protein